MTERAPTGRAPTGNSPTDRPSRRWTLAALAFPMTNAVVFGAGTVAVLAIPALRQYAAWLIPLVVVLSLALGAVFAWVIAPRMRARKDRDVISG